MALLTAVTSLKLGRAVIKLAGAAVKAAHKGELAELFDLAGETIGFAGELSEIQRVSVESTIAKVQRRLDSGYQMMLEREGADWALQADVQAAFLGLAAVLDAALPDAQTIVAANLNTARIAELVADKAANADRQYGKDQIGRRILIELVTAAYNEVKQDQKFADALGLPIGQELLVRTERIEDRLQELLATSRLVERAGSAERDANPSPLVLRDSPFNSPLPLLPATYWPRPTELAVLKEKLLAPATHVLGIIGMGGTGKTVLATALVHDQTVRSAFSGGIIWLSFGREVSIVAKQAELALMLTGRPTTFLSPSEGRSQLGVLTQRLTRSILVVLDDVWQADVADAFSGLSSSCKWLVTTRNRQYLARWQADVFEAGFLDRGQARAFLERATGSYANQSFAELDTVLYHCGGLPLALAAAAMLVQNRTYSWKDLTGALDEAALEELDTSWLPDPQQRNLAVVLKVSVDALSAQARECFLDCVVFRESFAIPEAVLIRLWSTELGGVRRTKRVLQELIDSSLLGRDEQRRYRLHDLYRDFLRRAAVPIADRHRKLLRCYRDGCPNDWSSGPNDGYFFEHLIYHLQQGGLQEELGQTLLDFHWLKARLLATDVVGLLADYEDVSGPGPCEVPIRLVRDAVRLSAQTIAGDPDQLVGHLLGRLLGQGGSLVQGVLEAATAARRNDTWLRPMSACLSPPGGPLVRTLRGRADWLVGVAASRDGRMAVTASETVIEAWDLQIGVVMQSLKIESGQITDVTLTSNGRLAIAAIRRPRVANFAYCPVDTMDEAECANAVMVWDIDTNTTRRVVVNPSRRINAVAVAPNDQTVVSALEDGTLIAWDLATGSHLRTFTGHTGSVVDVTITPNGQFVLSAGGEGDGTLRLWELNSGLQACVLAGHSGGLTAVTVTSDNRFAISAGEDRILRIWNLATGEMLRTLNGHIDPIHDVAVTSDGRLILSAAGSLVYSEDNTIRVWDIGSGRLVRTLTGHGHSVSAIAALSDHRSLLSVSLDGTMSVWDLASTLHSATKRHDDDVNVIAVTPDGLLAVSAANDRTLKVWIPQTGDLVRTSAGHTSSVERLALTADSKTAISASGNYASGKPAEIRVWDLQTGEASLAMEAQESYVRALVVTPDGQRAMWAGNDADVKVLDVGRGSGMTHLVGHKGWISSLAVTHDSQLVLSGAEDCAVRVWHLESGRMVHELRGHRGGVTSVTVTADDRFAISASSDHTIKVWDMANGRDIKTLAGHATIVNDVLVSRNGKFIVSSSGDGVLLLWDTVNWGQIAALRGHTAAIYDLAFTNDSRFLISASVDNTVRVWHVAQGSLAGTFRAEGGVNACACATDCMTFLAGDRSGGVHFLRLELPAERH